VSECTGVSLDFSDACGQDGSSLRCLDQCGAYPALATCMACYESAGQMTNYAEAWSTLKWHCDDSCGASCTSWMTPFSENCNDVDLAACQSTMCSGSNKADVDNCKQCYGGAGIGGRFKQAINQAIDYVDQVCVEGDPPTETTCDAECQTILEEASTICTADNPDNCKQMCQVSLTASTWLTAGRLA
jgi:hypothetical protein